MTDFDQLMAEVQLDIRVLVGGWIGNDKNLVPNGQYFRNVITAQEHFIQVTSADGVDAL